MPKQEAWGLLANFLEEACQGRRMGISLLSLNKSQPRMLDTSLQLWKSYLGIRTGVNKITPYQQMKCFTNKSATSWFFGKWRNCSHFFGLMIVFFSFFWLIFSMISLFVFKFLFQYLITYYLIIGVLFWFYFIFLVSNFVLYYPLFHFEFSLCFVFCLTGYLIFMLFLFVLFLFLCSNYSIFDRFWKINNEK